MIHINNGRYTVEYQEGLTVRALLALCRFTAPQIAVFVNGALIVPEDYDTRPIADGDDVRVLHMVAGG